jgi:hypothetical protein
LDDEPHTSAGLTFFGQITSAVRPLAPRPTESTFASPSSMRHSRKTPFCYMRLVPKRMTFMACVFSVASLPAQCDGFADRSHEARAGSKVHCASSPPHSQKAMARPRLCICDQSSIR